VADKAAEGARYRVSLRLAKDGHPERVDWLNISPADLCDETKERPVLICTSGATPMVAADGAGSAAVKADSIQPPYKSVFVVGDFNSWKPREGMVWDQEQGCYHFHLRLGYRQQESFQMIVDGDCKQCLHPDEPDASHHLGSLVCGPDGEGHGKNWTIGLLPQDRAARGAGYEVRLYPNVDSASTGRVGQPARLDWQRLDKDGKPEVMEEQHVRLPFHQTVKIVGTWNGWKPQQTMAWDACRSCYHAVVEVGRERLESFQFWLDGDATKSLHPRGEAGSPFVSIESGTICGPDNDGHGKNWTIGLNPMERASCGVRFEVRLFLAALEMGFDSPIARRVDWVRMRPSVARLPRRS